MNRASKNESASTSGSDREAPSEGSLKHTVLTRSLDSGSFSEISLMVDRERQDLGRRFLGLSAGRVVPLPSGLVAGMIPKGIEQ